MTDIELERRLRAYYRAEVGADDIAPLPLRRDVVAIPRSARSAHRLGRGRDRGVTLFAAAALLLVAGAAVAGSGLLRLPSVVPPEPVPSLAVARTAPPVEASSSPTISPSPAPSEASSVVAPNSGKFAYIQSSPGPGLGGLWVANADGTGADELVPAPPRSLGAPAWSPDGTRLVFSRSPIFNGYPAGGSRLYLTDVSGSEPQLVDTGCVAPCYGDADAAFSSDGARLVFVRSLLLPPTSSSPIPNTGGKVPGPSPASVLATIELSTGRVVELASATIVGDGVLNRWPRWSPDGTQIVFTQDVPYDSYCVQSSSGSNSCGPLINGWTAPNYPDSSVFVVDADGRNLHQLSPCCGVADWSPDGTRIVFESGPRPVPVPRANPGGGYTLEVPNRDIHTIRPDGTDLRRLTSGGMSSAPSWTADGRILFVRWIEVASPDGTRQLWIMDADGSHATQVSASPLEPWAYPYGRPLQP